ncbi:hypothetical protein PVA44_05170 [Entomospira nematocerorum]|uniref:6-bladed beta-propeller n=1 Tax=Entomospira nematocerorum TaxID=2719987 RepID=A0A968GE91_9SPIO|nr:hypothetical protein [Entomospira nematocera]NIZ46588.1 hypothetical protein [Entomospira nematocera]WDI33614.1 hypothetical protein PVA44_05170 [Entomospira nematocera]
MHLKSILLIILLTLLYGACKPKEYTLDRQDLFTVQLGVLEDEIDFFDRSQQRLIHRNGFVLHNGFFYVYNSSLGKVMKFSNNGDILALLYTPRLNIPLQRLLGDRVWDHNFNELEQVEISHNSYIYAVDHTFIKESGLFSDITPKRIIKVFNERGEYLYFLGQTGIAGEPFTFIDTLVPTANGMAVITREDDQWRIYHFSNSGELLTVSIDINAAILSSNLQDIIYITDIKLSENGLIAYINATHVHDNKNESVIYIFHTIENDIIGKLALPALHGVYPYTVLGSDYLQRIYFYAFNFKENTYHIMIYKSNQDNSNLQKEEEITLRLPDDGILPLMSQLYLARNGMIASMSIHERHVTFSWWRTDQVGSIMRVATDE